MEKGSSSKKGTQCIDGVTSDFVYQWYMDVYDIEGKRASDTLLFISRSESSTFEQVGIIKEVTDGCAGKEGMPCNIVKIKGKNLCYKLDPLFFVFTHIKEDVEYSLKTMGWNLGGEVNGTGDIVGAFQTIQHSEVFLSSKKAERPNKKQKTQGLQQLSMVAKLPQEDTITTPSTSSKSKSIQEGYLSKALVVSVPNTLDEGVALSSNLDLTHTKQIMSFEVKGVQMQFNFPELATKKGEKEDFGFHLFEKYFPFGSTTQFPILVDNCVEAPPLYTYRTLCWDYVEKLTGLFLKNPMSPATVAYLMPFTKENDKKRPMHSNEVDIHKLETYDYWIISGLHSIHAAKMYIQSSTPRCLATKHLYRTRNSRILVDCPADMCIELSRMTNMESHNVMKNAPYLEQLQQLRDQWIAFGSPIKPPQGLPKKSPQRVPWERFVQYTGGSCASRDCHMIVSSQEIFDGWITIMKKYSRGELFSQVDHSRKKGRQPSPATFRCLMGLKDEEITTLQQEVNEGYIFFLRNKWDNEDVIDMETRAKQIKQDRVLKEELVHLFNASISQDGSVMKIWEELVGDYNITDEVYSKVMGVCSDWVSKKLTRGENAGPLPNGAKDIVNFLILKKQNPHQHSTSLPWQVYVLGCNFESFELLHNVYKDPFTIGVVVLDGAHGVEGMKWDSIKFGSLLATLLKMTSEPKQFMLLSFLTRRQMASLEDALEKMSCRYNMSIGSVDFLPKANNIAIGAIDSFIILTLITMEKNFINYDRYVNNVNKPCILDYEEMDEEDNAEDIEEDQRATKALLKRKKQVINTTIKAFNDLHEVVLDVFSCGLASKVAVANHYKTIAIVCNTEEQREVEASCWRSYESIKPNSNLQEDPLVEPQIPELPLEGLEESSQDIASLIMKERMKVTSGV